MRVSGLVLSALFLGMTVQAVPPGRMPRAEDVTGSGEWTVTEATRAALNAQEALADCHADPNVFCMSYSRVTVSVTWTSPYSGQGGAASVLPQNDEFAYFYFTDPKNPEVFVKVLGDNNPDFIQLFVGGTTDFEYTVTFSGCTKLVTFHKPPFVYTGTASANVIPNPSCARGSVYAAPVPVTSLNGLTGDVTVKGGTGITVTPGAGTVTVTATGIPTTLPPSGPAGGSLTGTYPNPGIGAGKVVKSFGTLTDDIGFGVGPNMKALVIQHPGTMILDAIGFQVPFITTLEDGQALAALAVTNSYADGYAIGIAGVGGTASSFPIATTGLPIGVWGTSKTGIGVYGTSDSFPAVLGVSSAANWPAVSGQAVGTGDGVYGSSPHGFAGFFEGKVHATGGVSSTVFAAQIDHPLDPGGKILTHSSVESPDMKTIYDGLVTTDANGEATVALPAYFEALNGDFRYQLTVIGEFAQAIVAREIQGNSFLVRTSRPNLKVSWLVTGIRRDAYANAHRIPVEEDKAERERGYYLNPELFGRTQDRSLQALRRGGPVGPVPEKEARRP